MTGSAYAGLVTRMAALIVDGVLLAVVVPAVAGGAPGVWAAMQGSAPGWLLSLSQFCAALVPALYFTLFWWGTGQTLGGLLFGTAVRRPDGAHLSLPRAAARAVGGLLLPVVWLIGMGWVLFDSRRRALHDRLFGTVVVRRPVTAAEAGLRHRSR